MPEKARLSDAADGFLASRKAEGLARSTLKNDRMVLARLLNLCGNIYLENVSDAHITRYFVDAAGTRSGATLSIDHATLSRFFAWAVRARHLPRNANPYEGRKAPRFMPKDRRRVEVGKFPALLEAAGRHHRRDRMVVALGLYLFLRGGELADLRVGDVSLDSGEVYVRIPKTRQIDRMPICEELDSELRSWLMYYGSECGPLQSDWYLVPAKAQGGPITDRDNLGRISGVSVARLRPTKKIVKIESVAQRALGDIGFPLRDSAGASTREGIHTLRRSGARARYDVLRAMGHDGAVRQVGAMLHHKSITQTEWYLGIDLERQQRNELTKGKPMFPSLRGENVVTFVGEAADA